MLRSKGSKAYKEGVAATDLSAEVGRRTSLTHEVLSAC
jgi:hypothetical protein